MGLFSGSKEPDKQYNQAYPYLQQELGSSVGATNTGIDMIKALLSGDSSGFDAYKGATGFDAMAEQGSRGITNNAAASGLLRSGSTSKGLASFYGNLQNQFANQYLANATGMGNLGLGAGQIIGNAGQIKNSSKGKPGIGDVILGGVSSFI